MASKVDLVDRLDRECLEVGERIEPKIPRADVDVVDIAEDAAAGSTGDFSHEFRLGDRRVPIAEVDGRVLNQQPPAEPLLRLLDVMAKDIEALLGVGQRQQVVEVGPADRAPRQVLGDEHGLDPLYQRLEAVEMTMVEV